MEKKRIILLAIFIIAILVRLYNDPTIPYHYDPGKNIVYERAISDSFPLFPQYNPYFNLGEYYEYQILFPYIVALFHKITGLSLIFLTSWSAIIIGSLLVITVYLLSKEIFNNDIAALISAGLIALSKIQLFSYMNYYPQITALMLIPLAFISIIRYTKTLDKKYLVYTSILSLLIILSSYLAGMFYLSTMILSLMIYSILRKDLKYIYALILTLIGTIALISFYILPIINRHGVRTFILGIINTIFAQKQVPFTNAPIDVLIPVMFQFIIVILLIIFISLIIYFKNRISKTEKLLISEKISSGNVGKKFRKRKSKNKKRLKQSSTNPNQLLNPLLNLEKQNSKIKFEYILLSTWTLISIILIMSYKFRPILWVDRYLEYFDMAITIIAGYSIYFILDKIKYKKYLNSDFNYNLASALFLAAIFAYPINDVIQHQYVFGFWDTPSSLESLNWVKDNIPSEALFVAPSGITGFWVSALGGVHILGGESSQILGERFDGNSYSDTIINSPSLNEKLDLIRKFGVQYIYLDIRQNVPMLWRNDYNSDGLKTFVDNPNYFEPVYVKQDNISSVYIVKVKENMIPKYNHFNINNNITFLGYITSMFALIFMIFKVLIVQSDKKTKK